MTYDATLSTALRILAGDIQSEDGVANSCIAEAAARIDELHAEVLHLRIYAPGRHVARKVEPIKRIAPTDFAAWGITPDESEGAES